MDYTKKIIYQSNYWYNDGLKKAQIRDMSGAVVSLRKSLQYNRGNIAARNLLGLVYYGRGEVAEGLVEWIISKNLKPHDNIANYFINKVQNSASRLETINQAVKKYNQCLAYCAQNGEDLAVIQLKKVILDHPSFLKAYQLLALLYLHTEQYAKARQILKTARKLDTTNEMTLRYIHELMTVKGKKSRKKEKSKKGEAVEYHLGNETIIQPKNSAVRELAGHFTVMNILVGAAIGAAIVWFLIAPAVNQSKTAAHNKEILEYSEKIHSLESQASALQKTLDNYRISGENAEKDIQTAEQTKESYENLMAASSQYDSGSYSEDVIADTLINVNRDVLGGTAQARFDELTGNLYPTACDIKYSAGNESLEVANYENAVTQLSAVVKMNESYDDGGALLNLGLAYMGNGDNDNAILYLKRLIELFPDTEKAAQAQTNLDTISGQQASENENTEE